MSEFDKAIAKLSQEVPSPWAEVDRDPSKTASGQTTLLHSSQVHTCPCSVLSYSILSSLTRGDISGKQVWQISKPYIQERKGFFFILSVIKVVKFGPRMPISWLFSNCCKQENETATLISRDEEKRRSWMSGLASFCACMNQ